MKNTEKKEKKEIKLLSWGSDGVVSFLINDKTYRYHVDAAFIPGHVKKFKRQPWIVLNEVKRNCRWWVGPDGQSHENTKEV